MYDLLRQRRFAELAAVIQSTTDTCETDTDLLAEQARASLARAADACELLTPLSS
jgi:hypothetical protein